jgi:hypothetical protein
LNKKVQRGDWKRWKRDWPYKGDVKDPVYLMERAEFFKENGNGWWWYQGYHTTK